MERTWLSGFFEGFQVHRGFLMGAGRDRRTIEVFGLGLFEAVVGALLGHEVFVLSLFDDGAAVEDDEAVGAAQGGESMGDGEGGAAGDEVVECGGRERAGLGVQDDPVADGHERGDRADAEGTGQALLSQSRSLQAAGRYPEAAATIERALRIDPRQPVLWLELGTIRLKEGDFAQAESIGRKALSLATGDGANDVPMFEAATYAIAYRAKPVARAAANGWIDRGDLTAVLRLLGIAERDWVKG